MSRPRRPATAGGGGATNKYSTKVNSSSAAGLGSGFWLDINRGLCFSVEVSRGKCPPPLTQVLPRLDPLTKTGAAIGARGGSKKGGRSDKNRPGNQVIFTAEARRELGLYVVITTTNTHQSRKRRTFDRAYTLSRHALQWNQVDTVNPQCDPRLRGK